ncbi:hypothetical protein [Alkalimonas amylolytica]|uniref:DUF3828 domain-containing protein n=1 Tax=Alkalimonas amylolytica TaxID=152573 RepID=A0A1H4BUY6_ALKAM|nr:hypothetical protein [Alkalimonas amylolytica]SEA51904.1 hypothetical protein SAMN04488051_103529 [Alkalimonas amylolytica]
MHLAIKRFVVIAFYFSLIGCAWSAQSNSPFYSLYTTFLQASRDNNVQQLQADIFSQRVVSLWHESNEPTLDEFSPIFSYVSSLIDQEHTHFYSVNGDRGCFSINVITTQQTPATVNIEFVLEQGHWKLNDVMLDLLGSKDDFVVNAVCPLNVEAFLQGEGTY